MAQKINSVLPDRWCMLGTESVVVPNRPYCYNEMADYGTLSKEKLPLLSAN